MERFSSPSSSWSIRSSTYGIQVTPDSPRMNLKFGNRSQAPDRTTLDRTSAPDSWKTTMLMTRWVSMYFSRSCGLGLRGLRPVVWKDIDMLQSSRACHITSQSE